MSATQHGCGGHGAQPSSSFFPDPNNSAILELYQRLEDSDARVFRLLPVNPGPHVSTDAVGALTRLPAEEAGQTLTTLAQSRLIEAYADRPRRWKLSGSARTLASQLSDAYADHDGREWARDRLLGYYLNRADAAQSFSEASTEENEATGFPDHDAAMAWLADESVNLIGAVHMATATGRQQVAMRLPLLLAEYFSCQKDFEALLAITEISLELARQHGYRDFEADALTNRGGVELATGRFQDAVSSLQVAIAIFREIGDRGGEADALNNLGIGLRGILRFEEAISVHQAALTIYRDVDDRHAEGGVLNNLAIDLRESRRFEEAVRSHEESIAIYRATNDHVNEIRALRNFDTTRAVQAILS